MAKYKTYKKQRYLFFWLSVAAFFVPYVVVTACLLPFMRASEGQKWGIGLAVVAVNALPFIAGVFKSFRAHFPFFNLFAILFVALASFFCLELFHNYVATFLWIELSAAVGSVASCVLWHFHRKYKRKAQTVGDVVKSGVLPKE